MDGRIDLARAYVCENGVCVGTCELPPWLLNRVPEIDGSIMTFDMSTVSVEVYLDQLKTSLVPDADRY